MRNRLILLMMAGVIFLTGCMPSAPIGSLQPTASGATPPLYTETTETIAPTTPAAVPTSSPDIADEPELIVKFDVEGERSRIQDEFGYKNTFLDTTDVPVEILNNGNWAYYFACEEGVYLAQYDNSLVRQSCIWVPVELYQPNAVKRADNSVSLQKDVIYPLSDGGCYAVYNEPMVVDDDLYPWFAILLFKWKPH